MCCLCDFFVCLFTIMSVRSFAQTAQSHCCVVSVCVSVCLCEVGNAESGPEMDIAATAERLAVPQETLEVCECVLVCACLLFSSQT